MTVTNIPNEHHIVRHCKHKLYFIQDGRIVPWPEAFHLKPATDTLPAEDYLSGVYYEWCEGAPDEKMAACTQFIPMKIKGKDALIRMNAGAVKAQRTAATPRLRVTHESSPECPPYATIRGQTLEPDNELCQLLIKLAIVEPAVSTVHRRATVRDSFLGCLVRPSA